MYINWGVGTLKCDRSFGVKMQMHNWNPYAWVISFNYLIVYWSVSLSKLAIVNTSSISVTYCRCIQKRKEIRNSHKTVIPGGRKWCLHSRFLSKWEAYSWEKARFYHIFVWIVTKAAFIIVLLNRKMCRYTSSDSKKKPLWMQST